MADLTPIDLARFWSRVEGSTPFQCWLWRGQKNEKGYGRFRGQMAHRLAYELVVGPIPDGELIRHRCDNPPCCNPGHLEPGSHADNSRDAIERERLAYGERSGKTRLTWDDAIYIKANPDKLKLAQLAERFGVCKATISYIRSGRSWRMVGAGNYDIPTSAMSMQRSSSELRAPKTINSGSRAPDDVPSSDGENAESPLRCQRISQV